MSAAEPSVTAEVRAGLPVPVLHHPEWASEYPWLAQGISDRGPADEPWDLRLFGGAPATGAEGRIRRLAASLDFERAVVSPQVHGGTVHLHADAPGLPFVADEGDGHGTVEVGVLLLVTVADCVPVYVVDPDRRAVALLHAGWRSAAAGILETGVGRLGEEYGTAPGDLDVHLGPSICGACYEVGPEVHAAFGLPEPTRPTPIDLRKVLADRAWRLGVSKVSTSGHCTRCGDSPFFSHRGGDTGRQMAFLGIRRG